MADSLIIGLSGSGGFSEVVNKELFPLVHQAVQEIAATVASQWQSDVLSLTGLRPQIKDDYAASIQWKENGDLKALCWTDLDVADKVESGFAAYDLKAMLNTSAKVRRTKDGRRFLIIPFRHNTPGNTAHAAAMNTTVAALAGKLTASRVTGSFDRPSGLNASNPKTKKMLTTPQATYKWGGSLPAGLTSKLKPFHTSDPTAGMVRMKTNAPGSSRSSGYLTFRVMMEGSPKWIVPAKAGTNVARNLEEKMQPFALAVMQAALTKGTT